MKISYKLQDKPNKEIRIEYKIFFREIKFFVDDKLVGEAKDKNEIKDGKYITLENGHQLTVHFSKSWGQAGFDVYYDHAPVPGSLNTLEGQSQIAFGMFIFLGVVNMIGIFLKMKFNPEVMSFYNSFAMFIFGGFYLSAAYFVKRGSFIATAAGTVFFILDFIGTLVMSVKQAGGAPPVSSFVFMKTFISIYLIKACIQMKKST